MRLLKWHDTSTYTYLASTKSLFGLFMNWKWDSPTFMKPLVGEYRAFVDHLFFILAVRKNDIYCDVKSSSRGTLLHVNHCSTFWQHKTVQESLGSKILFFPYVNLQHFEGLNLRILKCPETFGSRLCDYLWAFFWTFWCPQNAILSSFSNLSSNIYIIWHSENAIT